MEWFQFGVTTDINTDVQRFNFRQPVITGKRASIAQAAYEAGFDCSDPDKLIHLIDAVVLAEHKSGYPDRWDGPAAFRSTLYPDHWTSAHVSRKEHANSSNAYGDLYRHPTVPAFAASAAEIVRNLTAQSKHASGSNRQPLGERGHASLNKRPAAPLPQQPAKRSKTKVSGSFTYVSTTTTHVSGLPKTTRRRSRRIAAMNALQPESRATPLPAALNRQPDPISAGTEALLKRVAAKIKINVISINNHRDALRDRWDVDHQLKLSTITDCLRAVNDYFNQSEKALDAAIQLVERNILELYLVEAS
ncbi:MAG: hypothetical protein Q9171_004519 [Xanthocarpia ochracea]